MNVIADKRCDLHRNNDFVQALMNLYYAESQNSSLGDVRTGLLSYYLHNDEMWEFNDCKNYPDRFAESVSLMADYQKYKPENLQSLLQSINERTGKSKENGVYYTPEDLTSFIVLNSIAKALLNLADVSLVNNDSMKQYLSGYSDKNKLATMIANLSIYDPTCGTGAFIAQALETKLSLIQHLGITIDDDIISTIVSSLHGTDLDNFSLYVLKIRVLLLCSNYSSAKMLKNIDSIVGANFIACNVLNFKPLEKYDVVVGNPPYVESSKLDYREITQYGNVYADVLHHSLEYLKEDGVLGMVIPISYISTKRMAKIRNHIELRAAHQIVLSYSDRPDCLFSGVHQKLNILFAKKKKTALHKIFTSDYCYWYAQDRSKLFQDICIYENNVRLPDCYLKLSNDLEYSIYQKVTSFTESISQITQKFGDDILYVNMRATYWIKSFITDPGESSEYSKFAFTDNSIHLVNCVLNSSLFWWHWVKISDCWHLTNKELTTFTIPSINANCELKLVELSKKIDAELQRTKQYIGSKQTMYEYKHKMCINTIDLIDNQLAEIYHLTPIELEYIKSFKRQYRTGEKSVE
ncbi:MAG: N-6 DNA methylase [Candidatus Cloacimonas sp.]|jgi:type I restriction-modification system DNA methylase subunit|nr:N-6 DNA methylase [Candidatus Cloacimonas sp.]